MSRSLPRAVGLLYDTTSPQAILGAPVHAFGADDWLSWLTPVVELLDADEPAPRGAAVERLAMAVFWVEPEPPRRAPADAKRQRLECPRRAVNAPTLRHPDVVSSFLEQLRYKGDDPAFADGFVA